MKYFNFKYICVCIFFILILLLISYSHFIFEFDFSNKKIVVKLKIKLLFKLIKLKIQLYPPKKINHKKKIMHLKNLKILDGEFSNINNFIKKVKIIEIYSNLYFGNDNPYVIIYVNALINGIYGTIINICDCEKIYLNVVPNFNENNINGSIKLHIKFRLNTMFKFIPILIRIIKLNLKSKKGDKNEGNKFNSKHYGDNS